MSRTARGPDWPPEPYRGPPWWMAALVAFVLAAGLFAVATLLPTWIAAAP